MGVTDERLTGGQLLVAGLKRWGVDTIFGLPGVQLDWFFDAVALDGGFQVVHTRHEQATSYMADGYARASGKVGVCAVVPGPGVLNAGAGLSTAYANNSPVLCIAGQVFVKDIGQGRGALHEIPDQLGVLRGTVGWAESVTDPGQIPGVVDAAFDRLTGDGRRRPAAIEIGWDTLRQQSDARYPDGGPTLAGAKQPDPSAIEDLVARLAEAERPLIYVGGGALGAGPQIAALAEALQAPVVPTFEGRGALPASHPLAVPNAAGASLLPDADTVLVVGSRFHTSNGPLRTPEGQVLLRIDVDGEELARKDYFDVMVEADAAAGLAAVHEALPRTERADRTGELADLRSAVANGLAERHPELTAYATTLRDVIPTDGILVDEMTQVAYASRNSYPVEEPRTLITAGYQGTLGYGYPTALGAKVGAPDKAVVSINGDGGFLYNAGELATAVHHGLGVVAVVFHDEAYGNVKRIQQQTFDREIASTLTNPDFAALGESFGMRGYRATDPESLRTVLDTAIAADEPAIVDVPIGPQPDIWPTLLWLDPVVKN